MWPFPPVYFYTLYAIQAKSDLSELSHLVLRKQVACYGCMERCRKVRGSAEKMAPSSFFEDDKAPMQINLLKKLETCSLARKLVQNCTRLASRTRFCWKMCKFSAHFWFSEVTSILPDHFAIIWESTSTFNIIKGPPPLHSLKVCPSFSVCCVRMRVGWPSTNQQTAGGSSNHK